MKKELLQTISKMSYYTEPNSDIRSKLVLDLSNYATKNN